MKTKIVTTTIRQEKPADHEAVFNLIEKAFENEELSDHKRAKELGYKSVVLLGHEKYYPRFGYSQADRFGIELPFDVPKENCMAIELTKNGLEGVSGVVEYSKEFMI